MLSLIPVAAIFILIKSRKKILTPVILLFVVIISFCLSYSTEYLENVGVQKRMVSILSDSDKTVNSLLNRRLVGTRHFKDVTFFQYVVGVGAKTKVNQICDNGFIQMVLYGGIISLVIYICFLMFLLRSFLRMYLIQDEAPKQLIALVGLLSIISWFVYEWVADAFWNPQTCLLFVATIATCFGYVAENKQKYNIELS